MASVPDEHVEGGLSYHKDLWDERGGGRRWWKKWPSKESYDVNQGQKGQDVGIWDGDIRKFTNGTFNGYFPDIRDIANRAIRPESQLSLNLNGGNITDRSDITLAMSVASTSRSNVTLQKYQKFMTESFEPDLDTPKTPRTIDNYKNPPKPIDRKLLSLKSEKDYDIPKKPSRCTRVERFLVGTSLYLAIAVLIMLIIITVMVFSLKDINKSIANINVDDTRTADIQQSTSPSTTMLSAPIIDTSPLTLSPIRSTSKPANTTPEPTTTAKLTTTTQRPTTTTPKPTTTTPRPTTTTPKPTTTTPEPTTTTPRPTTTTPEPTTTTPEPTTTTPKPTTTTPEPTTTTPRPTTTTPEPTTTTPEPTTTTPRPTTTTPEPTTTTPRPTTTTPEPTTTTPEPTTTTPRPTTTTPEPTTTTPRPTTTTPEPTTTTPEPTTTTPRPTTTTPKPTTTTPRPTTTTPEPTTTTPRPTTTTPKPTTTTPEVTTVSANGDISCDTSYCSGLAYNMNGYMNTTVDKCIDFYSYACGTWVTSRTQAITAGTIANWMRSIEEDNKINFNLKIKDVLELPDSDGNLQFSKTLKQVYRACLDYDSTFDDNQVTIEMLLVLSQLEFDETLTSPKSIEDLHYMAMFKYGASPLFRYDVTPYADGDNTLETLTLSPSSLYMERDIYDGIMDDSVIALDYLNRVPYMLDSLFGTTGPQGGLRRRREAPNIRRKLMQYDEYDYDYGEGETVYMIARRKLLDVFELEKQLHQIIPIRSVSEGSSSSIKLLFGQLNARYPALNWTKIFPDVGPNKTVVITDANFFYGLDRIIGQTNTDTVKFYELLTIIFQGIWKYLPYDKRVYMDGVSSATIERYSWLNCVNLTLNLLNKELHREYATKMSNEIGQSIDDLKSIIRNITNIMEVNIYNSTELSEATRNSLQNILSTIKVKTMPLPIIDPTFIMRPSLSFLFAATECLKKRYSEDMASIGMAVSSDVITWSDLQSQYDVSSNTIELPLGLTSRIDVVKDPIFPVLSSIGYEVASNVIQALYGDMKIALPESWWSSASSSYYLTTWTCFDNQLSSAISGNKRPNTGEIMTGDGALQLVLQEFERQMISGITKRYFLPTLSSTPEQLFLLHFTQNFCEVPYDSTTSTNKDRINNILKNSYFFQEAYKCSSGDDMHPGSKCSLL